MNYTQEVAMKVIKVKVKECKSILECETELDVMMLRDEGYTVIDYWYEDIV